MDREELLQLIYDNRNLIYFIANKYPNVDKEDLYQAGELGLIKAYKTFDKSRDIKFSTYAFTFILGEIKACARKNNSIVLSKDVTSLINKVNYAREFLYQEYMREPTIEEIASYTGINEERVSELLNSPKVVTSLDAPVSDDEMDKHEIVASDNTYDVDDMILLNQELQNLAEDERKMLWCNFVKEMPQRQIADIFGISQVQVSRKIKKILQKMRMRMAA